MIPHNYHGFIGIHDTPKQKPPFSELPSTYKNPEISHASDGTATKVMEVMEDTQDTSCEDGGLEQEQNLSEIEQLRYRISQLEHLIAMPEPIDHSTSTNTYNYASISVHPAFAPPLYSSPLAEKAKSMVGVLPPDVVSAILPNYEAVLTQPLLHRIDQLESLLAGSEIDNRNVKQQFELLNLAKNRRQMEFHEELKKKDLEIETIQEKLRLADIQEGKNVKKLATIEKYINKLPSEEELNHVQAKVNKLSAENDFLNNRLSSVKAELSSTQRQLMQKERQLQDALARLDDLKPLEEAQRSLLKESTLYSGTKDADASKSRIGNEKDVLNLMTLQKAQLIQSDKIISALRAKVHSRDTEKNELIMTLADKVKCIGDLEGLLACLQIENENITEREKRCIATKNELEKECECLKSEIETLHNSNDTRNQQMIKLIQLVTQVELCCSEMEQLIQLCQAICNGEEPSIEDLVGLGCNLQLADLGEKSNVEGIEGHGLDLEWIVQKIVDICNVRKDMQDLRTKVNNLYTDSLAQDVEKCNVQ